MRKVHATGLALRQSERSRDVEPMPWEVAAIDSDGNELYRTEGFDSREAAQQNCDEFASGEAYWCDNIDDEVDHFEPRRRE